LKCKSNKIIKIIDTVRPGLFISSENMVERYITIGTVV